MLPAVVTAYPFGDLASACSSPGRSHRSRFDARRRRDERGAAMTTSDRSAWCKRDDTVAHGRGARSRSSSGRRSRARAVPAGRPACSRRAFAGRSDAAMLRGSSAASHPARLPKPFCASSPNAGDFSPDRGRARVGAFPRCAASMPPRKRGPQRRAGAGGSSRRPRSRADAAREGVAVTGRPSVATCHRAPSLTRPDDVLRASTT